MAGDLQPSCDMLPWCLALATPWHCHAAGGGPAPPDGRPDLRHLTMLRANLAAFCADACLPGDVRWAPGMPDGASLGGKMSGWSCFVALPQPMLHDAVLAEWADWGQRETECNLHATCLHDASQSQSRSQQNNSKHSGQRRKRIQLH